MKLSKVIKPYFRLPINVRCHNVSLQLVRKIQWLPCTCSPFERSEMNNVIKDSLGKADALLTQQK